MSGGGDSFAQPPRDTFQYQSSHVMLRGCHFKRTVVVLLLLLRMIEDSVKIETFLVMKAKKNVPKKRDNLPALAPTAIPTPHSYHRQVGCVENPTTSKMKKEKSRTQKFSFNTTAGDPGGKFLPHLTFTEGSLFCYGLPATIGIGD